ncbi:MAG: hypothetical protein HY744_18430 [Deltaproteobacteria bacterium]|nr:hypothetical protein [Deltaproteobacteria bacterium]
MSMPRTAHRFASPAFASVLALALGATLAAPAAAGPEDCRGTQKWYAGECRYPKDIEEMKKQEAQRRAAEAEAKRKADAEAERKRREAEQAEAKRKADAEAERKRKEAEEALKQGAEDAGRTAGEAVDAATEEARRIAAEADRADCNSARKLDTIEGWRGYLARRPAGLCRDEAKKRIAELERAGKAGPAPGRPADKAPPGGARGKPAPAAPSSEGADKGGSAISPLVWAGFGAGLVGIVVGTATGILSAQLYSELEPVCPGGGCPPDKKSDLDQTMTLAHVSTAGFALGGVGLAVGIVGLLLSGGSAEPEPAAAPPAVALGFEELPGGGLLTWRGRL